MQAFFVRMAVLFAALTLVAQAEVRDWKARVYHDAKGNKLPYRLLLPAKAYGSVPLVLFFHGAGERGDDNAAQLENGVDELFTDPLVRSDHPALVVAPQCPLGKRWVEVDWGLKSHRIPDAPSQAMEDALELVGSLLKRPPEPGLPPIDPHRVYVMGMSMGGYATWDALARRPHLFAAAVPICGGGDESTAARISAIPVWAFHGAVDPVVPTVRSRHMVAALRAVGAAPLYTEYPGVGHASWRNAFAERELMPWLFSQSR
jgi:predicted peptidase